MQLKVLTLLASPPPNLTEVWHHLFLFITFFLIIYIPLGTWGYFYRKSLREKLIRAEEERRRVRAEPKPTREENCLRCGTVFNPPGFNSIGVCPHPPKHSYHLCPRCNDDLDTALKIEMHKQPTTLACGGCRGTGEIKGHRCVSCNGQGSLPVTPSKQQAFAVLRNTAEWRQYIDSL
jgi:hypothetical protein